MRKWKKRLKRLKFSIRKRLLRPLPGVLHVGRRALVRATMLLGHSAVEKHFTNTAESRRCFEREMLGQKLFGQRPWMVPMVLRSSRTLLMPRFDDDARLDRAVLTFSEAERHEAARQAVQIAWEIFDQGHAHRDFQARNFFWVKNRLILTDFETLEPYPHDQLPPFPESYDLTGRGLASPFLTGKMGYAASDKLSLQNVLRVPLAEALAGVQHHLKDCLREQSLSFKTRSSVHLTRAERIYGSFDLPHFRVDPAEAQRNSSRRIERFGMGTESLRGARVLDLGCNLGAMLFEAQKFQPAFSLGVEYDVEKVELARSIARYNGLRNVQFQHGDVDQLEPRQVEGPFDAVFCFAINKHVKKPERLYELLPRLTARRLFFEGNGGTDVEDVARRLEGAGFRNVRFLGMSDDDCLPSNNKRPLFVAERQP